MHKKLAADLSSLAHSILRMNNKEDVVALKEKAYEIYEKLAVLAYVEEYINTVPDAEETKEELLEKIVVAEEKLHEKEDVIKHELIEETPEVEEKEVESLVEEGQEIVEEKEEIIEEEPEIEAEAEEEILVEVKEEEIVEEEVEEITEEEPIDLFAQEKSAEKVVTLDEELKDTIAVDVVADLFENAQKKSLNDKLHGDIQIGLNDRIAFVKNLFEGSQEDFNRVVSQLNTFKTEKEAKKFINKMVKPDYNWTEAEEYETRFMSIIERKFA